VLFRHDLNGSAYINAVLLCTCRGKPVLLLVVHLSFKCYWYSLVWLQR